MISFSNRSRKSKPSAFTLIELLVAIAIIAMLAAILFPVFGRARDNARRASCQSNMKQIGLGMMQYVQDYDERLIPNNVNVTATDQISYAELMQPYVKSTQIFQCPSDRESNTGPTQCLAFSRVPVSYALNQIYVAYSEISMFNAGEIKILPYVETPSDTIFIGDGANTQSGNIYPQYCFQVVGYNFNPGPPATLGLTDNQGVFVGRHFEGVNWAFMDGHVKWMRFQQATDLSKIAHNGHDVGGLYRYFTPQDD